MCVLRLLGALFADVYGSFPCYDFPVSVVMGFNCFDKASNNAEESGNHATTEEAAEDESKAARPLWCCSRLSLFTSFIFIAYIPSGFW
ncbi:hypothetical protein M8C21_023881 [Ambrosia artemisiifolia]|uniref:Uncharacterized protein n=1 Tax=Ambrosia artemisiifolia TaxID=4212 RepID=A0AAD5DD84_AMBAR|nr:hypothetical protein M8C21_023881 [Ambrosia artemisiifolia]